MAARRSSRRRGRSQTPGWVWMCFGLAVGLSIAAAIHLKHQDASLPTAGLRQPAPAAPADSRADPARSAPARASQPAAPTEPRRESRFDFYELLPQFEVVLPETETPVRRPGAPGQAAAVEAPGSYILQAGSFRRHEDADRMRANLALRGIESSIQRVQVDTDTFHRVRIGPIDDLQRLEQVRGQLREARIDTLLIRLPD